VHAVLFGLIVGFLLQPLFQNNPDILVVDCAHCKFNFDGIFSGLRFQGIYHI
jgi:hypothetical protein